MKGGIGLSFIAGGLLGGLGVWLLAGPRSIPARPVAPPPDGPEVSRPSTRDAQPAPPAPASPAPGDPGPNVAGLRHRLSEVEAELATARAVYLFQVRHREVAAAVAEALATEHILKAGVSVSDDLKALKKVIDFSEKSVIDLGTVVTRHGLKQTGVRNLAGLFLGFRIPKGTKTSNWSRPRLTDQQITYAATDAWACRELYLLFRKYDLV